jgi:cytochrome c-type biogenesis protein
MDASDVTLLVAFVAGLLSFLSPCVLPLVPAYIGQLTVVAVVGRANAIPSRWLAVRHAVAYVLGFGAVFTILGITATFVGGPLADYLPALRTIGGVLLIVMGLNLAGILKIPVLQRRGPRVRRGGRSPNHWYGRIRDAGRGERPRLGDRLGGRLVGGRGGIMASFGLGVVFAIGWTPCIGIIPAASSPSRRHRERRCRAERSHRPRWASSRSSSSGSCMTGRRRSFDLSCAMAASQLRRWIRRPDRRLHAHGLAQRSRPPRDGAA